MFKKLREKFSGALKRFSKEVEEEPPQPDEASIQGVSEQETSAPVTEVTQEKATHKKEEELVALHSVGQKIEEEETQKEDVVVQPTVVSEEKSQKEQKKSSFFGKISSIQLSEERFEELFWDLEVALLEANVSLHVVEKIKQDLSAALTKQRLGRKKVLATITNTLRQTLKEVIDLPTLSLPDLIKQKKPYVIAFIGVNGSGKTTTLAKVAYMLQQQGFSCVMAAADTFRAAAIEQLSEHATKLGIKLIKHEYRADPSAVAFDAIRHATAKGLDVVLIDTAGRLHSNDNLMQELKKLIRVNKPDLNVFVGEATTGNDCVEQAELFGELIGIDAIILAKADVDEKGGAAISAAYVTKKPVLYFGVGQGYGDLKPFFAEDVLASLGF